MVASWPSVPLPTDYWKRPISAENREWYPIAGAIPLQVQSIILIDRVLYASNYKYTAYVQAPNTCHVAWRRQGALAALSEEQLINTPRIAGGGNPNIFYAGKSLPSPDKNGKWSADYIYECYDLRTGQIYWDIPVPRLPHLSLASRLLVLQRPHALLMKKALRHCR